VKYVSWEVTSLDSGEREFGKYYNVRKSVRFNFESERRERLCVNW